MATAVSGTTIDVNTLVTQLMAAERTPLTAIQKVATTYQSEISAFGQLRSGLASLGDSLSGFASGTVFRAAKATSSDTATLTASAAAGTAAGNYNVEVQTLAQAQKLSSTAFAAADSAVGSGTLTIQLGTFASGSFTANPDKAALNITVDASNNTLAGLRDAINAANAGVRASIVNDGSGYRLTIGAADGGTANSLRMTVTGDGDGNSTDSAGLSRLAYDPAAAVGSGRNLTQSVAAQDAVVYIDGVRVVKSSNSITDAIDGVTLNLAKASPGSTVAVTVGPDTDAMKSALDDFVKAYNSFNSTARNLTYYDATKKTAGALQGDATARSIVSQVKTLLTGVLPGLSGNVTRLPQIGLTLQGDGSLKLDGAKFTAAVQANPAEISALFANTGRATDTRVQYQGAASAVAAGSYTVAVTQAATRGRLTGDGAAGLSITAGVNDALSLTVDGKTASVTLSAGTYASADALAAELQSRLNGDATFKTNGIRVAVSASGGALSVTSANYGAGSSVATPAGNAAAGLFGTAPVASAGTDVAGTINGVAATGTGQMLASADGLRLKIAGGASGALGSLAFSRGYGSLIADAINRINDTSGALAARTDGLNASIKRNTAQQDAFNTRMTALEARYRTQYSALDAMLSSMATTSNYLAQQLSALSNNK